MMAAIHRLPSTAGMYQTEPIAMLEMNASSTAS